MHEPIRILQLVNGLGVGGAEKKLLDLVKHLDPQKYRIFVCSIGQGGPLELEFRSIGIDVLILKKKNRFDVGLLWKVVHLIRTYQIDMVQTTLWLADVVGAFAAWIAGNVPCMSWETVTHGDNDILRIKKRHVWLYRLAMRRVSRIVAVSDEIRESLIQRRAIPDEKISVIHYGVNLKKFNPGFDGNPIKRRLRIPENHLVFGTVARMESYKGVAVMQEAAIRIVQKHPNVTFVFVGDGTMRARLEQEVQEEGFSDQIRFLGSRDDVHELMAVFDVLMLASLTEGLPNVILEAMASAKPVIATRVGGIPEAVVQGETGVLIPPGDVGALADAIRLFISDPEAAVRMGANGRKRAEDHFSVEQEVKRFEILYQKIIMRP